MPAPIVAGAVAKGVADSEAGKRAINDGVRAGKILLGVFATYLIYKWGSKKYKQWRAKRYLDKNGHKIEVQTAIILYKAMHRVGEFPFGGALSLFFDNFSVPDGTDETALKELALKVKDKINLVSKAYKYIFDRNFIQDLHGELGRSEIQAFFARINSEGSDLSTPPDQLVPYFVGSPVYVRNNAGIVTRKGVFDDDEWDITNVSRGRFEFGERIGVVHHVLRYPDGEIDYIIDQDYSWDGLYGYTVADHRDLLNKSPEA